MKKKGSGIFLTVFWLLFAAAAVGLYVYAYVLPGISGSMAKTVIAEYGEMETFDQAECLFIRDEDVVYSQHEGTLSYYSEDTEKNRKDSKILDIYPAGKDPAAYRCAQTGFISYFIDGLEDVLYPGMIADMTLSDFEEISAQPEDTRRETAHIGEPLYKMINRDEWFIVFPVPFEKLKEYREGSSVTLQFEGGSVTGTVEDIIGTDDIKLISVSCKKYYEPYARVRRTQGKIVTSKSEGLIIPVTALCEKDGKTGVYVRDISGEYDFKPVRILCRNDENCIITPDKYTEKDENGNSVTISSVKPYDEVLRYAEDLK